MFSKAFQIDTNTYPIELFRTKLGYSVGWHLKIKGEIAISRFGDKVGFSEPAKKRKLDELIKKNVMKH